MGVPREGASAFIMNQPASKEEQDRVSQTDESHIRPGNKAKQFGSGVTRIKSQLWNLMDREGSIPID